MSDSFSGRLPGAFGEPNMYYIYVESTDGKQLLGHTPYTNLAKAAMRQYIDGPLADVVTPTKGIAYVEMFCTDQKGEIDCSVYGSEVRSKSWVWRDDLFETEYRWLA